MHFFKSKKSKNRIIFEQWICYICRALQLRFNSVQLNCCCAKRNCALFDQIVLCTNWCKMCTDLINVYLYVCWPKLRVAKNFKKKMRLNFHFCRIYVWVFELLSIKNWKKQLTISIFIISQFGFFCKVFVHNLCTNTFFLYTYTSSICRLY